MTPRRALLAAGAALLALGLGTCALVALRQPMAGGDYVAIWGLKARALHRAGTLEALFRVDPGAGVTHPDYPPLWPLALAAGARLLGRYDELALGALWPLLAAASAGAAALATRAGPPFRLLAAAAVALLPYFRTPLHVGYAEALLLALVLGALAALDGAGGERPLLAAALFTLAAWTKQEGALAGLVTAAVLLGVRRRRAALAIAAGVLLLAVVPWRLAVARYWSGPLPRDFAAAAFDPAHLAAAAGALLAEAAGSCWPWLAGGALLLAMAPGVRRARRGWLAGAALYTGALGLAFAFTTRDPAWHVRWTWDRLAILPAAVLLPVLLEAAAEASRD